MSVQGMDPEVVRALALRMSARADEIQSIAGAFTNTLRSLNWVGNDRERFLETWQSQHVVALTRAVDDLREASHAANANADQQERASRE